MSWCFLWITWFSKIIAPPVYIFSHKTGGTESWDQNIGSQVPTHSVANLIEFNLDKSYILLVDGSAHRLFPRWRQSAVLKKKIVTLKNWGHPYKKKNSTSACNPHCVLWRLQSKAGVAISYLKKECLHILCMDWC